jgi:mycothiol synthase
VSRSVGAVQPPVTVLERLAPSDVEAVHRLVERVAAHDEVGPMSEHVLLHLPDGGDDGVLHVLARDGDGALVGYGHLDVTDRVAGSSAELAVDPQHRRAGIGRALVEQLLRLSPDGRLRLWAHGDSPGAAHLAADLGLARTRVLLQMRRQLTGPLPEVRLPDGIAVRTFVPGQDDGGLAGRERARLRGPPRAGPLGEGGARPAAGRAVVRPVRVLPGRAGRRAARLPLDQGARGR